MPTFDPGTVVRVPFPYTNRPVHQYRPAVVVSAPAFNARSHLLWVVMVTSAENRRWPDDISLEADFQSVGLPAPSLIRPAKIATIEAAQAEPVGHLPPDRLSLLLAAIAAILPL